MQEKFITKSGRYTDKQEVCMLYNGHYADNTEQKLFITKSGRTRKGKAAPIAIDYRGAINLFMTQGGTLRCGTHTLALLATEQNIARWKQTEGNGYRIDNNTLKTPIFFDGETGADFDYSIAYNMDGYGSLSLTTPILDPVFLVPLNSDIIFSVVFSDADSMEPQSIYVKLNGNRVDLDITDFEYIPQ